MELFNHTFQFSILLKKIAFNINVMTLVALTHDNKKMNLYELFNSIMFGHTSEDFVENEK